MIELGLRFAARRIFTTCARPIIFEIFVVAFAPIPEACDIANRRIYPYIEEFIFVPGNLESEIWRIARNTPSAQWFAKPFQEFIRNFILRMLFKPRLEIIVPRFEFEIQMLRFAEDRLCAACRAARLAEFLRAVCCAALDRKSVV